MTRRKKLNDADRMAIAIICNPDSLQPCYTFESRGWCKHCPKPNDFDCTIRLIKWKDESSKDFVAQNVKTQERKVELLYQYLLETWGEQRLKELLVEELI